MSADERDEYGDPIYSVGVPEIPPDNNVVPIHREHPPTPWLVDAADLLGEPDPGPTPWLIEGLIVDEALTAAVGRWKTTKSWAMLECAISIATGTPAFANHAVPEPGPVVYVIEESGRRALWRRLDALLRGRAIRPEQLRGMLHLAMNERIKLDDPAWQAQLIELGLRLKPRAFIFDPLARMKASERKESDQTEMAPVLEFLRILRDETNAAPCFVHHTGHQGEHMRGSSDLESVWESRLSFDRDKTTDMVTVTAAHREEEDGTIVNYKLTVDRHTRTIRLRPSLLPLEERCIEWLLANPPSTTKEVATGVNTRESDVLNTLERLREAGRTLKGRARRLNALGAPTTAKLWEVNKTDVLEGM